MCDSDSEEFASADEDFEEIEPDELEEVLQSTKPSDVGSSKKKGAHPPSTQSDVEPVDTTKAEQVDSTKPDGSSRPDPSSQSTTVDSRVNTDEKASDKTNIEGAVQDQPATDTQVTKLNEGRSDEVSKTGKTVATNEVRSESNIQTSVQSNLGPEDSDQHVVQNSPIPPPQTSSEAKTSQANDPTETSTTSKKLVLKPAKPQLLDEMVKRVEEKEGEQVQEPSRAGTDEGWDDFDDDWGDFTVEGGASNTTTKPDPAKQMKSSNTSTVSAGKPTTAVPSTAKASFRDVDIDEVEDKLKDFMKHKDDPPLTSVLDRLSMAEDSKSADGAGQSWGSWKPSWGGAAVSFLSSASKSVASITTNITQVIESGIGVPNPEELARRQAEEEAKLKAEGYIREESESNQGPQSSERPLDDRFGFDQLVSGVTQISSKVISGGLDTLEGIGKKTMTILQENDPGLLNKRKLLGLQPNDGVVLSQVLREAKAKTEERERNLKQIQKHQYKKKLHFETLFDDYHGLVHLEALEMLSKQASLKLESLMAPLTGKALEELQETMSEVKELCELPETDNDDADGLHSPDELEEKLKEAIADLNPNVKVDFSEIVKSWVEYTGWLEDRNGERTGQDVFEKAMHALAQTTALCVLRMHKLAEILLISEHHSTATEADVVVQLTTVFGWHLSGVATRFCSELTKMKDESGDDSDSALITNIFLEGSNSTSYVQNAFHLFVPILQLGAA
ncbi:protein FAM114A2 [Anopheles gambiae]|uniref:protein FAM114A2 n=1 Tax=Anopheles gambiae TaxID=7165 RepID=UPI002AC8B459|nr:protein FAM114A2 [Anopheles gambiae]